MRQQSHVGLVAENPLSLHLSFYPQMVWLQTNGVVLCLSGSLAFSLNTLTHSSFHVGNTQ